MTKSIAHLLSNTITITFEDEGNGPPLLLLHGGAGPVSMKPLMEGLKGYRTIVPAHPGFDNTERPAWCSSISDLTTIYLAFIEHLGFNDLTVIGNSAGGWIAAELAARRPSSISRIVLMNSVGLMPTTSTGPIIDPTKLAPEQIGSYVFANPAKFAQPITPQIREQRLENQQVLNIYAGKPFMHDPSLQERLRNINVPTLILWGEADRIVTPAYGKAFCNAISNATFQLIPEAGHFPHIEQTASVLKAISDFSNA